MPAVSGVAEYSETQAVAVWLQESPAAPQRPSVSRAHSIRTDRLIRLVIQSDAGVPFGLGLCSVPQETEKIAGVADSLYRSDEAASHGGLLAAACEPLQRATIPEAGESQRHHLR